jgi:hypothetical protein
MKESVKLQKLHERQIEIAQGFKQHKKVVIRCGRRFGKTSLLERCAAKWAFNGERVGWLGPKYKLNAPTYGNLIHTLKPVIQSKSKIDQLIQINTGGLVEFWTLEDENAGRSRKYHKVIVDEASLKAKGLKEIIDQSIRPTLLDYNGSIIMAGTPKGIDPDNYFYEACTNPVEGWVEYHAPTASNPHLDPDVVATTTRRWSTSRNTSQTSSIGAGRLSFPKSICLLTAAESIIRPAAIRYSLL